MRQKLCAHGRLAGSVTTSWQIEHLKLSCQYLHATRASFRFLSSSSWAFPSSTCDSSYFRFQYDESWHCRSGSTPALMLSSSSSCPNGMLEACTQSNSRRTAFSFCLVSWYRLLKEADIAIHFCFSFIYLCHKKNFLLFLILICCKIFARHPQLAFLPSLENPFEKFYS